MANASIVKELRVKTPDELGIAGRLTSFIADQAHANIKAFWGGTVNNEGIFSIITENNAKVAEQFKNSEFKNFNEHDVLVVHVPDELGSCAKVANKVAGAGININYLYTTMYDKQPAVILSTDDNQQAFKLFN